MGIYLEIIGILLIIVVVTQLAALIIRHFAFKKWDKESKKREEK